jgi:hypothetical protein
MKVSYILAGISSMLSPMLLRAGAGGDISPQTTIEVVTNSQVWGCDGTNLVCNYAASAVGDLREISISGSAKKAQTALGAITTPRSISLQLPRIGGQELFTLTLTQPFSDNFLDKALVNVPMEVLFVSSMPDAAVRKEMPDALSMVKIYRRMGDETLWNERGTIPSNAVPTDLLPITVTINPDGVAEFIHNGEPKAYHLGKG